MNEGAGHWGWTNRAEHLMNPTSPLQFAAPCAQCQQPIGALEHVLCLSTEWVEFPGPGCMPQVAIVRSARLAHCCSSACLKVLQTKWLARFSIKRPNTSPGVGPVEVCARCNGIVDMTAEHLCLWHAQSQSAAHEAATYERLQYSAVCCRSCSAVVTCLRAGAALVGLAPRQPPQLGDGSW